MKALQYIGPKELEFCEMPIPKIGPNDILMKVKKVGICGTDLHIYKGGMNLSTPLVMGHEFVGHVERVGSNVTNVKVSDRVVAEHVIGCGKCTYCHRGLKNLCLSPVIIGLHTPGALAEYLVIPSDLVYTLPDALSYDDGVLIEPLSIAVYAIRKGSVKVGHKVGVVGQGPIGIFVDQVAKASGADVYGFDINDSRLNYVKSKQYVEEIYNTTDPDYIEKLSANIKADGLDIIFEAVGIEQTAQISLDLAKRSGKVVILGVFEHNVSLNMMQIVKKELSVLGSWTCNDVFNETITLVQSKKINTSDLITNRYKFDEAIRAFSEASDTSTNRIKSVIEFD